MCVRMCVCACVCALSRVFICRLSLAVTADVRPASYRYKQLEEEMLSRHREEADWLLTCNRLHHVTELEEREEEEEEEEEEA